MKDTFTKILWACVLIVFCLLMLCIIPLVVGQIVVLFVPYNSADTAAVIFGSTALFVGVPLAGYLIYLVWRYVGFTLPDAKVNDRRQDKRSA